MQTRTFRTLLTVSELGSFAATAKRLNMTLSAVSMQMKVLEQDLSTTLFDRSQRPPALTAKGREVVEYARAIVEAERDLVTACQPDGMLKGTFHVGFVLSASVRLLPGFLAAAADALPEVRFEVETGLSAQLEAKTLQGRLDLAVLTASGTMNDALDVRVLAREPLVYAVPRALEKKSIAWLLANVPFLHFAPSSGIGRVIAAHVAHLSTAPFRTIVLDGMEGIVECVKAGIGFTILPQPDVERYADGGVRVRAIAKPGLSRDLALVARTSRFSPEQLRQVEALFA